MAEIKTVLPPFPGEHYEFSAGWFYSADQMRAYAEAAVLSANAGKVDAEAVIGILESLNEQSEVGDYFNMAIAAIHDLALSPTQQAIDAGKV